MTNTLDSTIELLKELKILFPEPQGLRHNITLTDNREACLAVAIAQKEDPKKLDSWRLIIGIEGMQFTTTSEFVVHIQRLLTDDTGTDTQEV
jgi:hypothetical protein